MAKFRSNNTWEQQRFYWEAHESMQRQAWRMGLGIGGSGIGIVIAFVLIANFLASFNLYSFLPFFILVGSVLIISAIYIICLFIKEIVIPVIKKYKEYKQLNSSNVTTKPQKNISLDKTQNL